MATSQDGVPVQKRFNAVDINKRFLQKNASPTTPGSVVHPNTLQVATVLPSQPHSKLVTAKLTSSSSQLSPAAPHGWSRPSSATPPVSASPANNLPPPQPSPALPHFPHAGKVIQPQPRCLPSPSTKPAWGIPKQIPIPPDSSPSSDFPTAAEVAQGRLVKQDQPKQDQPRHASPHEADAFRGVHLDPNAHHWDEMEEDDDNFLDNVIEFGDGRQYKVATGLPSAPSTTSTPVADETPALSPEPVTKQDRFADDFDRSWPRTSMSPIVLHRDLPSRSSQHPSPTPSHPSLDPSRALFNERSNRLEPCTTPSLPNRLGSSFGFSRRNAHSDLPPVDPRFGRDPPPHTPLHLFQKHVQGTHDTSVHPSRSLVGCGRNADRDNTPDHGQNKLKSRDIAERRHRRLSTASFASSTPDGQQQTSADLPFSRRSHARDSPSHPPSALPANVSARSALTSTAEALPILDTEAIHKAIMRPSVDRAKPCRQLEEKEREKEKECARKEALPILDIEGVHKTAMRLSAERAKQRRQLEEEEREKEKERARKKADEIEARIKEAQKMAAIEIIPQAATLASDSEERDGHTQPSSKPTSTTTTNGPLSPLEHVDLWRSKTRLAPVPAPSPSILQEPFGDDNLEVVDFSDLGKFVGGDQALATPAPSSQSPSSSDRHSFPVRPVASDFFEDAPSHSVAKSIASPSSERHSLPAVPETSTFSSNEYPVAPPREHDSHRFSGTNGAHFFGRSHPSPTVPHHRLGKGPPPFRQVTMSALDDVMSRIKGALDNMQVDAGRVASPNETMDWRAGVSKPKVRVLEPPISTRTLSKEAKWLPPALREPQQDLVQEAFGTTCCDPPCSPRLPPCVRLPATSRPVDAIPRRQLHLLKNLSSLVRFDTLSWDPPVDGMSRRDLSVNEVLFKRSPPGKGNRVKYKVHLPRTTRTYATCLPKVNLPLGFPGRSKAVDDLSTWRRGPMPSTTQKTVPLDETSPILDVTSCSPPPEIATLPSDPAVTQEESTKSESFLVRQRTQPKLPAGSAVGFYRDPGLKTGVNFTVTSELEESSHPESSMLLSSSIVQLPTALISSEATVPDVDEVNHGLRLASLSLITQADGKVSEESTELSLRTPASASFSTSWTKSPLSFSSKDSPARAPDPEHLKAVWSQAADKEQVSAVNSLEGIADDLTALPFTIQEVKSEDGETPPPTSAAVASKISLHDVTRAFQQVPAPPNVSSHRPPPPLSPVAVNGPAARPQTFNYPTPVQAPGVAIRPHFAAFSSPMLSPSPTVLYPPTAPSPIPRVPLNGHPQLYNQPMWVPMQTSQNNSAVRPVPSPYPAQMVAYPAPTPVHPIYASGLSPQSVPPSVSGSAPPRPRGMPMLSPVMHPAAPANVPMYNGSPVLIHPSAMIAPGHRPPYMNSGPSERGQGRSEGMSVAPHMQQTSHSQNHVPPQPMYQHVPFQVSRPSW